MTRILKSILNRGSFCSLLVVISSLPLTSAYAADTCTPKVKSSKATCDTSKVKSRLREARTKKTKLTAFSNEPKTPQLGKEIKEAGLVVKELEADLKEKVTQCTSMLEESKVNCQEQDQRGKTNVANGQTLLSQSRQAMAMQDYATGSTLYEQGTALVAEGEDEIAKAQTGLADLETERTASLQWLKKAVATSGTLLVWLINTALALGFKLFGDDGGDAQLASAGLPPDTDICSTVSGADVLACGDGTPDRQTGSGGIGNTNGTFSGGNAPGNVVAASDDADDRSRNSSSDPAAIPGGGGGGGNAGFGGGGSSGGGGKEPAAVAAAVNAENGGGFFGGSGGGGGGGASGGFGGKFDRFGLKSRLKGKTKAEKKKIIAAFKKQNQLKGKGRGLASNSKDGKAGPYQDNFMVIRKAHQQNYRSLFHK